eukprot:CAMPEP_0171121116 /NCGR_PEP_ID=MMETSP0766_2-20121228/101562_1 /TAXON_ID=439317 /ORGANISM="Gambierdiscus australes, Strain CAWD 149" /LENGTH=30 /DNA_ID= /DNA_START= /DNA_END= /DNA_ORIENTATION=
MDCLCSQHTAVNAASTEAWSREDLVAQAAI